MGTKKNRAQLCSLKGFNQNDEWWSLGGLLTRLESYLLLLFFSREKTWKGSVPLKTSLLEISS